MMVSVKISKRVVDTAEPRVSRYTLFDTEVKGFGLRVFPSGQKSYVFEYRPGSGGRRVSKKRITIGSVGDFTPDEARKHADRFRAEAKVGDDPLARRIDDREALTVRELARSFLTEHVAIKRAPRTAKHYGSVLDRLVAPTIGARKAKDVTRADLARLHASLRSIPFQANRVLAVVGSMYGFAGRRGLVPEGLNPARGIEKFPEDRRERFLTKEELRRLGDAIREAETFGIPWNIDTSKKEKHVPKSRQVTVVGEHAVAALRLLIFTGARLREILHLRWSEVDLERGILLLPKSKTGRKTIVLNAAALDILKSLSRMGPYVISSGRDEPRADLKRPWALVSERAGLEGVRLHDLRHTFASFGAGKGLGLPVIGKLLGHSQSATTARYAHLDTDPLRVAADVIGTAILGAMGSRPS